MINGMGICRFTVNTKSFLSMAKEIKHDGDLRTLSTEMTIVQKNLIKYLFEMYASKCTFITSITNGSKINVVKDGGRVVR